MKETAESVSFGSWGDFLMLASVLNWGVFLVISRKLLKSTMTPAFSIFWELVFAAFFAFLATLIFGTDYSVIPGFTAGTWLSIIFLGALSSGLAYLFWYKALAAIPVAKLTVFQFLQPVAGMVISYLLLGERYTIWLVLGAAIIRLAEQIIAAHTENIAEPHYVFRIWYRVASFVKTDCRLGDIEGVSQFLLRQAFFTAQFDQPARK